LSEIPSAAGPDPTSACEWFRRRAARDPGALALSFERQNWTYGQLDGDVERVSAVPAGGGVGRGDRAADLGFNHSIAPMMLMAASRLGAIFVPFNFRLSADELRAVIGDAGVHTLITDEPHAAVVEPVRRELWAAA
jgi:acyl-CoA synthetase (AMP-forming)/AMP-acid ligase II